MQQTTCTWKTWTTDNSNTIFFLSEKKNGRTQLERVCYLDQMGFESGFENRQSQYDGFLMWVPELWSIWCEAFLQKIPGKLKKDVVPVLSGNTDSFRVSASINGVIAVVGQRCWHVEAFISCGLCSAQITIVSMFFMAAIVALAAPSWGAFSFTAFARAKPYHLTRIGWSQIARLVSITT